MNRIKQILEEKGITQIWQDEKIDESFSQTNAYVCNRRQPRIEWLYEIASLLDVETKNLLVMRISSWLSD
uniref:helix-turn-helix domain-containing protein n=1 Tax=Phocaeicola plebeius TaxID=310297 RepID=UPI003AB86AC2